MGAAACLAGSVTAARLAQQAPGTGLGLLALAALWLAALLAAMAGVGGHTLRTAASLAPASVAAAPPGEWAPPGPPQPLVSSRSSRLPAPGPDMSGAPGEMSSGGLWVALGTLALLLAALSVNSRILLGIVVGAAIFVPIERLFELHPQRVFRAGWMTDIVHLIVSQALTLVGLVIGVVAVGLLAHAATPEAVRAAIADQPGWAQFAEALTLVELIGYWMHRASHTVPWLWRFHKVHHAIGEMDWLAAGHLHPIDQTIMRTAVVVPLFALGFSKATFGAFLAFEGFTAIFNHANVRLRFGPLAYVIATPHYHHWHHADHPEAYGQNLGLPVLDWLFGTRYLPDTWPTRYGLSERQPAGYLRQLAWPFRRPVTA